MKSEITDRFLSTLVMLALVGFGYVIVHQQNTIEQQRKLIDSFRQDKACMHAPR